MKKVLWVYIILFCSARFVQAELVWDDISCGNTGIKSILIDPASPGLLYAGSKTGVLKSQDAGRNWRNALLLKAADGRVNILSFGPADNNIIYAATSVELFRSNNRGESWLRIFRGSNYLERDCTALLVLPGVIYLGTSKGLFASRDNGRSWQKESGWVGGAAIKAIGYSARDKFIYLASYGGIYRAVPKKQGWERVLVGYSQADNGDNEEPGDGEHGDNSADINCLSVEQASGDVYVATSRGVYRTSDRGQSWNAITDYGLLSRNIKFIFTTADSRIYAVTSSGIFIYVSERWQELSFALAAGEVYAVNSDRGVNLYAACEMGLFKAVIKDNLYGEYSNGLSRHYQQGEPSINEVQQAAIKYAEVGPEKILRWRKQAAKRAWLPRITLDMDRDMDRTISNSIWGTSSGGGTYFMGPDDVTKYKNKNWGVSLTWELGDLIYNDAQTSIDVRSRLMVELRNDILDEVTRVYFERLRVKAELDGLSIEDRKKRQDKELRVAELTALLDAMTEGYFSHSLKK